MEWLKEILKGLENADELEKKITGGIGKSFVAREDFNTLNTNKKNLDSQFLDLQKSLENGEDFKKKYEDLEKQIKADKEAAEIAAKEAAEESDFQTRFNSVVGEQKWRDELTQSAMYAEFKKALSDKANKGKGDKDIMEALTKDKNYYTDPGKDPVFAGGTGGDAGYNADLSKMRAVMGLPSITETK